MGVPWGCYIVLRKLRKGVDMDKLKIVYKKLDDLTPYENNPRLNDNAVDAVAKSIEEFGFKVPIVIDKDGVIVAGHTRLKAAKQLAIDEVPCIIADDLSSEELKAFRLADNKVSELAGWDWDKLEEELEELKMSDIEIKELGFEENDVLDLSYIDELDESGLSMTKGESDHFVISFTFPIEKQGLINEYIKNVSKEKVVEDIILAAEGLKNA